MPVAPETDLLRPGPYRSERTKSAVESILVSPDGADSSTGDVEHRTSADAVVDPALDPAVARVSPSPAEEVLATKSDLSPIAAPPVTPEPAIGPRAIGAAFAERAKSRRNDRAEYDRREKE